jgi:hypothetical protein
MNRREIRATLEAGTQPLFGARRIPGRLTTAHPGGREGAVIFLSDRGEVCSRGELLGVWNLIVRPEDAAAAREQPEWRGLVREGEP